MCDKSNNLIKNEPISSTFYWIGFNLINYIINLLKTSIIVNDMRENVFQFFLLNFVGFSFCAFRNNYDDDKKNKNESFNKMTSYVPAYAVLESCRPCRTARCKIDQSVSKTMHMRRMKSWR